MPSVPVKVPSVGESISEGILAHWLKPDGGSVQAGEPLFELETDKASSVVPAPELGRLKIGVAEGETVAIGATVADDRPGRNAGSPRRSPRDGTGTGAGTGIGIGPDREAARPAPAAAPVATATAAARRWSWW